MMQHKCNENRGILISAAGNNNKGEQLNKLNSRDAIIN